MRHSVCCPIALLSPVRAAPQPPQPDARQTSLPRRCLCPLRVCAKGCSRPLRATAGWKTARRWPCWSTTSAARQARGGADWRRLSFPPFMLPSSPRAVRSFSQPLPLSIPAAMELAVATRSAVQALQRRSIAAARVFSGAFVTALDMAGFSLSVLPLSASLRERCAAGRRCIARCAVRLLSQKSHQPSSCRSVRRRLDAPTDAPAWPRAAGAAPASGLPAPAPLPPLPSAADAAAAAATGDAALPEAEAAVLRGCIAAAAEALLAAETDLTEWRVPSTAPRYTLQHSSCL